MTTQATGGFTVQSWGEEAYDERDEAVKLTRASVTQAFTGDLEGTGAAEWLMCYRADGTADFVGLVSVSGRLGDREGGFVLENRGTFDGKTAEGRGRWCPARAPARSSASAATAASRRRSAARRR